MKKDHRKLNELPIFKRVLKVYDESVKELGLIEATSKHLSVLVKTIDKKTSEETENALKKGHVLLISNHDYDYEMAPVIASLPQTTNFCIVAASHNLGLGDNVSKYVIPIHIRETFKKKDRKLSYQIADKLKLFPPLTEDEKHRINIESIKDASRKVNSGGVVLIFPSGVGKKDSVWQKGVGYLVKDLKKDTNIIFIQVKGGTTWDTFRLVPKLGKLFPAFKVTFSKPLKTKEFLNETNDPRKLTLKLEEDYNNWAKSLPSQSSSA